MTESESGPNEELDRPAKETFKRCVCVLFRDNYYKGFYYNFCIGS